VLSRNAIASCLLFLTTNAAFKIVQKIRTNTDGARNRFFFAQRRLLLTSIDGDGGKDCFAAKI